MCRSVPARGKGATVSSAARDRMMELLEACHSNTQLSMAQVCCCQLSTPVPLSIQQRCLRS